MLIIDLLEGVLSIHGRKGNKVVRKYRCTSGARKGRIVAKSSTCSAPLNVKRSNTLKRTRKSKGRSASFKSSRTKRTNPVSQKLKRLNTASRRIKRRSTRRKKI